ncbi:MAG: hypothetical protein Q7U83_07900, partial [Daejeonella sp.]|nr:hypothetical protein [Daejeonella sp.]
LRFLSAELLCPKTDCKEIIKTKKVTNFRNRIEGIIYPAKLLTLAENPDIFIIYCSNRSLFISTILAEILITFAALS